MWRDWKSNVLKKVAKHKTYMMGTGGGSPKELQLSGTENALFNFLTSDASGLKEIPEGGFTNTMPTYDNNETLSSSTLSYNIENNENEVEETFSNDYSNDALLFQYKMHSPIQQTKQHVQSVSLLHTNIHVKQRKCGIQTNTKVKKYDTFVLSLSNFQNVHQNKENWEQNNKTCGFSLDDTEKYTAKQSENISNFLIKFKNVRMILSGI
ncbi:uncharacterized protein LOC114931592 [Nylanderia fulva]|uniref:uncharacterized protein LOC114931592 n=1 Tax=Nylanderia fulva TaxID=613905 RepID=UPI0010FB8D4A|nr:uncharacterized protein LOC114931592 [Nylanderia fulva]